MNKNIERKIRQAELEFILLEAWNNNHRGIGNFQEFLEIQTIEGAYHYWSPEAEELLDIYSGE
jgi:hypothetical protein